MVDDGRNLLPNQAERTNVGHFAADLIERS
jgi:hypothetical protein